VVGFLVAEVLGGVLLSLVAAIKGVPNATATHLAGLPTPPEWVVVSLLTGQWFAFLGAPYLATRLGPVRHRLGLTFRKVDLWGIGIGLAAQIGVILIYLPFRSHLQNFDAPTQRLTGGSSGSGFVLIALLTVLGAPFVEEVFFRGLLLRGLTGFSSTTFGTKRAWALGAAVVVDGLLFGLAHGEWIQLPGLAAFGILLAFVTLRTGRLGMAIIAHCVFNGLAIASIAVVGG
jgi:membrane protease YdiL (CAAX protease family)